jgi:hypothetical protein
MPRSRARRTLIDSGVDPFTACQLVGWKDIEMLCRYNMIDVATLKRDVAKLRDYLDEQKQKPSKVAALGGCQLKGVDKRSKLRSDK